MTKIKNSKIKADIVKQGQAPWLYSQTVKNHFFCPKNFMKPAEEKNSNATPREWWEAPPAAM